MITNVLYDLFNNKTSLKKTALCREANIRANGETIKTNSCTCKSGYQTRVLNCRVDFCRNVHAFRMYVSVCLQLMEVNDQM